jgi:hypothetical protein
MCGVTMKPLASLNAEHQTALSTCLQVLPIHCPYTPTTLSSHFNSIMSKTSKESCLSNGPSTSREEAQQFANECYEFARSRFGLGNGPARIDSDASGEKARAKENRIQAIERRHAQSGVRMTKAEMIDCYGRKKGEKLHNLDQVLRKDQSLEPA